jgi:hypothetical protein
MKKKSKKSAFFYLRALVLFALISGAIFLALFALPALPGGSANAQPQNQSASNGPQNNKQKPDVIRMLGPVSQNQNLRNLPYVPPKGESDEVRRLRHPFPLPAVQTTGTSGPLQQMLNSILTPAPNMPSPLQTFEGMDSNLSGCACTPPDTDGDVGPNHYIESVNSSIRIHDKNGNVLAGPITYNSFFSALGTSTPCGNNLNDGDGIVFYDHIADRWVVSDFAFPAGTPTGAGPTYQCIGVSKTSDPVSGGWFLYALQIDSGNPTWLGDYPKFGLWPDAYYLSVNLFVNGNTSANSPFEGVRVFALDRASMTTGGAANAIAFSITPANLGDQYSLVPATFRNGTAPPAGQPEWFMDVNSSSVAGTVETQVFVRRFHADFVTPANSTFGVGAGHTPDGTITVNGFIDAFTSTSSALVPQAGTSQKLDTLGDKLMYPLVYQRINNKEYIYADQTVAPSNNGTTNSGPTAVRWYQFDMTANTIPATPTQQQDWTNGNDGIYRWMPSLNVDGSGNLAVAYSASSSTISPGIRFAGRLSTDPSNSLAQGEAIMTAGTGSQTSTGARWGDYTSLFVDPADNCTFYHVNEYYAVTSTASWRTRIGAFKYSVCTGAPVPTPTPNVTPTPTPTPTPTATPTATPTNTPTPSPTPPASAGNVTITATAGTVGPTGYTTLQLALAAINAGTHQGTVNVWIMANTTETSSAALNASGSGSANYTSVLILPNGTRTVSGNLAAPLIDLNGAKNVRIDGYSSLTLSNTNTGTTSGTSTVRFINGAQNDILANCTISGSATVATGTAGGSVLFHTTTGSGNNNNIVANNNIGPAGANLPRKCLSAVGTATSANTINTGNVIDNNNIFDFFNATSSVTGIEINTGNTNFTISNNRIYQTASRTFTGSALRYAGITINGTTGANGNFHTISGNTIGFGAANGTGTTTITGSSNEVRGIDIQGANSGTATSIQGNVISGINVTSSRAATTTCNASFAGIQACTSAGASATATLDVGTVTGNTIGSLDGSSTIVVNATSTTANTAPVFGILALTSQSNNISNNKMGAITIQSTGTVTGFRGIFPGVTAETTQTINNNTIGGATTSGAVIDTQVGNYALYGIQTSTAACVITGNVIRNLSGNANVAGSINESGIAFTSTSTTVVNTISQNTIYNLSNSSGSVATNIYGLDITMPTSAAVTGNLVERNFVHSLSITTTAIQGQIYGMIIRGGNTTGTATATVQNNMIRLGLDGSGNSLSGDFLMRGIRDSAAGTGGNTNNSYFYNSVYIGGSNVSSSSNSQAFFSDQTTSATSPRIIKNNIFYNARSTTSGAGKNYAIGVAGTAPNPTGLTSNFNDLYATGTAGFVGLFNTVDRTTLANWQSATGQDANSISADPLFVSPNGTATTVDLHLQSGSPAIAAGTPITSTTVNPLSGITNDFDGDNRNPSTPDIGADERTPYVAAAPALVSAASRMTHGGGAGTFSIPMPLSGPSGIEPRSDTTGNFTIVMTFDQTIKSGSAAVIGGTGSVSGVSFSGTNMIVGLTGVTDQQVLTLAAINVTGTNNATLASASVNIGFLWGDATLDRFVNAGDTVVVRDNAGVTLNSTNFQWDVNVDGAVNVGDTTIVRNNSGDYLP